LIFKHSFALLITLFVVGKTFSQSYANLIDTLASIKAKVNANALVPIFLKLESRAEFPFQKNACNLNLALLYKALRKEDSVTYYIRQIGLYDIASQLHFQRLQLKPEDIFGYKNFSKANWKLLHSKKEKEKVKKPYTHYAEMKFHFEDVKNFWIAFDKGITDSINKKKYIKEFIQNQSNPSMLFFANSFMDSDYFSDFVFKRKEYFQSIRKYTNAVDSTFYRKLQIALEKAKCFFKYVCYTDIYFTISSYQNSIALYDNGVLVIPINFYCQNVDTELKELTYYEKLTCRDINYLPAAIIHELVHPNQKLIPYDRYLDAAISEGMADYVAEQITGICLVDYVTIWTNGNSKKLWTEFRNVMFKTYDSTYAPYFCEEISETKQGALTNYWGYQICKAYIANTNNGLEKLMSTKSAGKILVDSYFEKQIMQQN
jgi:uncharacterized protein YjaZ